MLRAHVLDLIAIGFLWHRDGGGVVIRDRLAPLIDAAEHVAVHHYWAVVACIAIPVIAAIVGMLAS